MAFHSHKKTTYFFWICVLFRINECKFKINFIQSCLSIFFHMSERGNSFYTHRVLVSNIKTTCLVPDFKI